MNRKLILPGLALLVMLACTLPGVAGTPTLEVSVISATQTAAALDVKVEFSAAAWGMSALRPLPIPLRRDIVHRLIGELVGRTWALRQELEIPPSAAVIGAK